MLPLVTCLCLTRNRRSWLPQAIECFRLQAYANRELLIVADGEDVTDLMPAGDSRVRLFCAGSRLTIGAKRNYGCSQADGEIIAHWDDDDSSAPARLTDQVSRLLESGKAVTGYHSMRFRDPTGQWWIWRQDSMRALGTSLCYRRDYWEANQFPPDQVGEDGAFSTQAWSEKELITSPGVDFMVASIHPGNTCQRDMADPSWIRTEAPAVHWLI